VNRANLLAQDVAATAPVLERTMQRYATCESETLLKNSSTIYILYRQNELLMLEPNSGCASMYQVKVSRHSSTVPVAYASHIPKIYHLLGTQSDSLITDVHPSYFLPAENK